MSQGLSLRPRQTNRLAGQQRMYSLVNLAAAMLDRQGRDDEARCAAQFADALERWAKENVAAEELRDFRASGRTASTNLLSLAETTNRLFESMLEMASATVSPARRGRTAKLTERTAGLVLTFTVPLVRFTANPGRSTSGDSLADALADLRLPGAFDSLGEQVTASKARGDVVKVPHDFNL
jgi:hypothetical protein